MFNCHCENSRQRLQNDGTAPSGLALALWHGQCLKGEEKTKTKEIDMKRILLIGSFLALGACSSAKKQAEPVAAQQAPVPAASPVQPVKPTPEKKPAAGADAYTCQVLDDKRIVEFKTESGRCEIHYTKFGNSESVAWGQATPSICTDVFARIRTNIEQKGFACQDLNKNLAAK